MPNDILPVSNTSFHLVYDGPALRGNEMGARELSAALLAVDDLFTSADAVINGGRSEARLTVKASFKSGSFGIEFNSAVSITERFVDIFKGDPATAVANASAIFVLIFGGTPSLFYLIKWLRRRRPTRIDPRPDGRVRFYVGDDFLDTERRILQLFNDHKVRQALEEAVATPLKKEGISDFAVVQSEKIVATVTEEEAESFVVDEVREETLGESIRETWLDIVALAFKSGDKWRFHDGNSTFSAAMRDASFAEMVADNELEFGAATQLHVILREIQFLNHRGRLHKEVVIERVLGWRKPPGQLRLTWEEESLRDQRRLEEGKQKPEEK